jgi:CRISPR-associated protein Csm3
VRIVVFERLDKRILLSATLEAVTPLHIGSGKPDIEIGELALPVLRDPSQRPYIPGSSLKGRTRAEAERIARKEGIPICTPPNVKDMCGTFKSRPEDCCICCRIFGTAGDRLSVASKVKFRDAYPTKEIAETLERTGTAIDRELGSVAEHALYSIEAVPAGTMFDLEIVAENLSDEELKLLLAALKSVEDSALGGSSTRGFGKIKFHWKEVRERSAKFYLGAEKEDVFQGEDLKRWMKEKGWV